MSFHQPQSLVSVLEADRDPEKADSQATKGLTLAKSKLNKYWSENSPEPGVPSPFGRSHACDEDSLQHRKHCECVFHPSARAFNETSCCMLQRDEVSQLQGKHTQSPACSSMIV